MKVGEGTYGEAFKINNYVCKIVPFDGEFRVNGEVQKVTVALIYFIFVPNSYYSNVTKFFLLRSEYLMNMLITTLNIIQLIEILRSQTKILSMNYWLLCTTEIRRIAGGSASLQNSQSIERKRWRF